jgi:hypothetical protein
MILSSNKREKIIDHINNCAWFDCEGCRNNYPEQIAHTCLTDTWSDKVYKFAPKVLKEFNLEQSDRIYKFLVTEEQ